MSCNEWERGTVTLPAGQWAKFRSELLAAWNLKQQDVFEEAANTHDVVKASVKGKRGEARITAIKVALAHEAGGRVNFWGEFEGGNFATERYYTLLDLLFTRPSGAYEHDLSTLHKPRKADLKRVKVTQDCILYLPDASVTFCNATKSVTWDVSENNHARRTAHEHWFAKRLFSALSKVKWTGKSGGTIIGNDEYNRDSDYEGGGGHYVTYDFSKKRAAQEASYRAKMNLHSGYNRAW